LTTVSFMMRPFFVETLIRDAVLTEGSQQHVLVRASFPIEPWHTHAE